MRDDTGPIGSHEFDEMWKLMTLEEALQMELKKIRERDPGGQIPLTRGEQAMEPHVIELMDRVQRKRHGHHEGQPLQLEFYNQAEIVTAITAILSVAHLVDDKPEYANEAYDPNRGVRACISIAVDFERLHPDDDVIDGMDIEIPEVDDE